MTYFYFFKAVISFKKYFIYFYFKLFYIFIFRERGKEGEREGEKHRCGRITCLPLACPQLGTWPVTQACALAGNRTSNHSVHRPALNPRSLTSQDYLFIFIQRGRDGEREGEKH